MPKVWNMRDSNKPKEAVYVGRGRESKYGNPYSHNSSPYVEDSNVVKTREEAIERFKEYFNEVLEGKRKCYYTNKNLTKEEVIHDLKGNDLVCWCVRKPTSIGERPLVCHAQVLLELVM